MGESSPFFKGNKGLYVIGSAISFVASLIIYWLCVEPSASFWDCPEYIITAATLQPGHSPGNPAWSMTANIFASVARLFGNAEHIALAINLSSGIFTALAVMLLFQILLLTFRYLSAGTRLFQSDCANRSAATMQMIAALCGALCFAWCDSALFSAVEAEVYAMSILFTALFVRLAMAWAINRREGNYSRASRLLILTAYLTGVSLGVHELNLLAIPCVAIIGCFAVYPRHSSWRAWVTILLSFAVVGAILLKFMPGVLQLAVAAEIFCVNTLHMARHTGEILFICMLIAILATLPAVCECLRSRKLQRKATCRFPSRALIDALWCVCFLTIGYGVYMMIPIRSASNPPMNQCAPDDAASLLSYVKRDQYGFKPLFYGNTPYSEVMRIEQINADGTASYSQTAKKIKRRLYAPADAKGVFRHDMSLLTREDSLANVKAMARAAQGEDAYVVTGYVTENILTPELNMVFPRLTSRNPSEIRGYRDWTGMDSASMVSVPISYAFDSVGRPVGKLLADGSREHRTGLRPTYLQQLQYMLGYQFSYMYFRYLAWNFIGRQNDMPAAGEIDHGMPITGISALDHQIMQSDSLPDELWRDNAGRNTYLMLPFIFGVAGLVYLCRSGRRGRRAAAASTLLFLLTGVAIVFYLNQGLGEARERDYSFMGSFLAFAFWIGAGMWALLLAASRLGEKLYYRYGKRLALTHLPVIAAELLVLFTPGYMLAVNYDDHDRSSRHFVHAYASNLLQSLEPNAVIFVEGDNLTFPLWYAQEVLGIRRDVRVVSLTYLLTPWYAEQLTVPAYENNAVMMTLTPDLYRYGALERTQYAPSSVDSTYIPDAREALSALAARVRKGEVARFDSHSVRIYNPQDDSLRIDLRKVGGGAHAMSLRSLLLLDILANSTGADGQTPRPIYWQNWVNRVITAPYAESTSNALFFNKFTPGSNTPLYDESLAFISKMQGGGMDTAKSRDEYYVDPYLGWGVNVQRSAMLRLADNLNNDGRHMEAVMVLRRMEALMPEALWPYQGTARDGKAVSMGVWAAEIYTTSGQALGDKAAIDRGKKLSESENARLRQWRRYYDSLPKSMHGAVSPESRKLLKP